MTAERAIELLGLQPHPEGGFFRETYRAEEFVPAAGLPPRYASPRRVGTAIYYLVTPQSCSMLHRVASDEVFHFYLGDPVRMLHLHPDGTGQTFLLGSDLEAGCVPQLLVPRGVWQGSLLADGGKFALLGATVAPGFEYADFELARRADILPRYPLHASLIIRLTPED